MQILVTRSQHVIPQPFTLHRCQFPVGARYVKHVHRFAAVCFDDHDLDVVVAFRERSRKVIEQADAILRRDVNHGSQLRCLIVDADPRLDPGARRPAERGFTSP